MNGSRQRMIRGCSGKQPDAPLRLMLGKAALAAGRAKVQALAQDCEAWAAASEGADFPEA